MSDNRPWILAATDFSPHTGRVLEVAGRLARATCAQVCLAHVAAAAADEAMAAGLLQADAVGIGGLSLPMREVSAGRLKAEHRQLHEQMAHPHLQGVQVTPALLEGDPVRELLAKAERLPAAWIVLASHGHGAIFSILAGSVCQGVLKRATVPVVVVPALRK